MNTVKHSISLILSLLWYLTETMHCRILNYLSTRTASFDALQKYTDSPQKHYRNGQSHRDRYDLDIFLFTCGWWFWKQNKK